MDGLVSEDSLDFEVGDRLEPAQSFSDFPEDTRLDVEGLLWVGYLEDQFELYGHSFVIRTLRGDEELLAAMLSKEWVETLGQTRAFVWSQVSLCILSVDGDEDFCPPSGPDPRQYARQRFNYCTQNWYYRIAEKIFEKYTELSKRQLEALQRVEDLSTGSLPTSASLADSSNQKESSGPQGEEIKDYLDLQDSPESSEESSPSSS